MKKTHRSASGSPAKDAAVTAASILSIPMRTDWGIGKKTSPREGQRESTQKRNSTTGRRRQRAPPAEPLDGGAPTLGCTHAPAKGPAGGAATILASLRLRSCGGSRDGKSREEKWRWGASRAAVPRRRTAGRRSAAAARGEERPPACGTEERREMRPSF